MLVKRQFEFLKLIDYQIKQKGYPLFNDEMQVEFSLNSKARIYRLITGFKERFYWQRLKNKLRAIEVIKISQTQKTSRNKKNIKVLLESYWLLPQLIVDTIIHRQTTADDGDIILALIQLVKAKLKRFRCSNGLFVLDSINLSYGTNIH